MAYITAADVERELQFDFTATTTPTESEIGTFITQVEAELNGILRAVSATVPISSSGSPGTYAMVQQAATWGVCARAVGSYAGIVAGESPKESMYWERFRDFCDRVRSNPAILYDATFDNTANTVEGLTEDDDDYRDPTFSMNDEF
jgi:hypothetical protein